MPRNPQAIKSPRIARTTGGTPHLRWSNKIMNHTSSGRKYHPCPSPKQRSRLADFIKALLQVIALMIFAYMVLVITGVVIK